ncbi:MAG: CHAT domain-containing protein, partial [Pyrinomonadaceae bacterium]|nr:CHAT domain-containing protein [Pyrinomonadaceae bacterium]
AYRLLAQYDKALKYLKHASTLARKTKHRYAESIILDSLGATYYGLRQYDKAIENLSLALVAHRELKNRFDEAITLNNLGTAHQFLGRYDKSVDYFERSLAINRELKSRKEEGSSLGGLMSTWKALGKPRLAIFYGKQAVNTYQKIRAGIQALDEELRKSFLKSKEATYRELADILISEGRLPEAQQVLGLLKEEEYFEFVRRDSKEGLSLTKRADLTPEEAEWDKRYREIADQVTAVGREWGELRAKKSRTLAEDERLKELEAKLQSANAAFQQFLDKLAEELAGAKQGGEKVFQLRESQGLMEDLQELESGAVALYTVVGEEKYRVILVTPDVQKAYEYPIKAADLYRKVFAFREVLEDPKRDPLPLARELYGILIGPFAKDLQGARAETLMWSLDSVLRYIPIAALHDGERYMVERYRNVIFTPASNSRLKDTPSAGWRGLGFGVSKAKEGFSALPAVVEEINGIIREESANGADAGVLPGRVMLDEAFTGATMQAGLRQRYPVVHIASHFQFNPGNETNSFLLLGDGSHLSLAEIKTLPNIFGGVELLTLSACNTASSGAAGADGKEVEGFAVMAQRQGAKAVIASLWPVADASTRLMMQDFYRVRNAQAGMLKAEALRRSQLSLLRGELKAAAAGGEERGIKMQLDAAGAAGASATPGRFVRNPQAPYAHPYYWAPFILIGNWR